MAREREPRIQDNLGDDSILFKYSITSYGADYTIDGLVRRIRDGSLYVPSFQRGFVWTHRDASRFVESLLLGLPVPGIFLSKERETQKLVVIDGQQRLRTLQYFYEGIFADSERVFRLKGVQPQFTGLTYNTLSEEDRRRLDDSILHATVVKQDEPSDDDSSIYHIFERINTGGTQLQPQEIRACLYHGSFNDLLRQLNTNKSWRKVYGPVSSRMRDQELILRFLALYFSGDRYKRPMKEFLNLYMGGNRNLTLHTANDLSQAFVNAIEAASKYLGSGAFKPKRALNAAVFDAVLIGIARRLKKGHIRNAGEVKTRYRALLRKDEFIAVSTKSTADEENVVRRMRLATDAFSGVK